jgi:hypothetical protein
VNTRAANFAATVLAELQIGIKALEAGGPTSFEAPYETWSWEIVVLPAEEQFTSTSQLKKVEVVIRHSESGIVHRLGQLMAAPEPIADDEGWFTSADQYPFPVERP